MANTPNDNVDDYSSHIDFNLLEDNSMKATRPVTIQKTKPKTNLLAMPNSVRAMRSGSVSRAGQHRWPQAKMVVLGGNERQVYNTELLTVSTNKYEPQERSNEENRLTLPDITANGLSYQADGDADIPSRFAAKSPSKLSQLPAFSKTLLDLSNQQKSKNEENIKLIKSIKFWRGTTPIAQAKQNIGINENQNTKKEITEKQVKETEISKNDSILQTWTEQLSIFEESSKNKYFSWQMALRNRLLKHERMYYQEAVSRINKYRQQLRARPAFGGNPREISENMDQQLWKSLIQQHHKEKKSESTSNRPTGVSMSPSQEWKPYIAPNEAGQKKPPFFGNGIAPIDVKKKTLKTNDVTQPTTSSSKRIKHQTSSDLANSTYPVHGEALLKDESKNTSTLPSITASSPIVKTKTETNQEEKKDENDVTNDDEKESTRALLVDLKNQLLSKGDSTSEPKPEKPVTQALSENVQGKTGLGMKLRLLLQNSASPRMKGKTENDSGSSRQTVTARKSRSRMKSQQSGYRPISRPRTIGDSSLPKIHNIVSTSLWKRHVATKQSEPRNTGVKHRLTLAGVANREVFSSSVIGIAQKHITKRPKQAFEVKINEQKSSTEKENVKPQVLESKVENPLFTVVTKAATASNVPTESIPTDMNDHTVSTPRSKKKKNPAFRLYTPATIQQHQFGSAASLSKIQEKENPQYRSLKLVTSMMEKQKSPPSTPLEQFRARQQSLKGKLKSKTGGKHKVMRISVVEPPLTAKERFERQQESEKSRKRLTFNPTHAALNNLSTAILNSELDLRAPSSSPVDMFLRQYNYVHGEQDPPDYWGLQKPVESFHHSLKVSEAVHETSSKERHPINRMDGLMPPRPPVHIEGFRLNATQTHSNTKPSSAPKLKDLLDLQRLYQVMQKHGEAYTNGSAYFYSPSPNTGLEAMPKQQAAKLHPPQQSINKLPFYYYPYQGDTNIQAVNEKEGSPLYVVTGATSMLSNKHFENIQQSKKSVTNHPQLEQKVEDRAVTVPFRHMLSYDKNNLPHWDSAKPNVNSTALQRDPRNALTVIMPKTPGITLPTTLSLSKLEQIQEHIMQ